MTRLANRLVVTGFVVLSFWKTATSTPRLRDLISERPIFYNENIASISSLQKAGLIKNTTADVDGLMSEQPNLVYTVLKCTYSDVIVELLRTFYEINDYGISLRLKQTPNIKHYTVRWLSSSIDYFHGVRRPMAKLIDSLFSYSDRYVVLKTSDQSLLKSLLSINLFLYHSENDSPVYSGHQGNHKNAFATKFWGRFVENVRKLNASIVQMIGLMERFRGKRCVDLHDPYEHNFLVDKKLTDASTMDETYVKDLLAPALEKLHLLAYGGPEDDAAGFESRVYDPEYLLFGNLLERDETSVLSDARIRWNGGESDLRSAHDEVKNAYSVREILKFQHRLIEAIADTFYGQIRKFLTDRNGCRDNVARLLVNFDKFIEHMMPSNCSVNVCNAVLRSHAFLSKALRRHGDPELFAVLADRFKPDGSSRGSFRRDVERKLVDDPYLESFVRRMRHDEQHASFAKAFKLLSHEAHTNGDHDVVKKFNDTETFDPRSYDLTFLKRMIQLQYCLLAFRAFVTMDNGYGIPTYNYPYHSDVDLSDFTFIGIPFPSDVSDDASEIAPPETHSREYQKYGPVFGNVLRVVVKMYKLCADKPDVRNILLPLLIRFRRSDRRACRTLHGYECRAMLQTCFVTVTLVENHIISTNFFPFSSLVVYRKFLMYKKNGPSSSKLRHDIKAFAETSAQPTTFAEACEFANGLYDEAAYDAFFSADDKEVQFLWNGGVLFGHEIFRSVARGLIDFNDLISFQWFGVRWFVGKTLLVVINRLSSLYEKPPQNLPPSEMAVITGKLNELRTALRLSKSFDVFLGDVVEAINRIFNANGPAGFRSSTYERLINVFDCCFQALGLYQFKSEVRRYSRIEAFNSVINFNIENFKKFLSFPILRTHNILTSSEFSPSPIDPTISNETIKMLY